MFTLRQIEAFYWIAQLGTFERAANRLHTTQSAISKRIQELELHSGGALFDRSQRSARLTPMGESLLGLTKEMIELQERIRNLRHNTSMAGRVLRVGVTELSAQTWMPRFVRRFHEMFDRADLRLSVLTSRVLIENLQEGTIDLIVVPDAGIPEEVGRVMLPAVQNIWMARPGLMSAAPVSLHEMERFPLIVQRLSSGYAQILAKWVKQNGLSFAELHHCDSLLARVGMAVAGLGISYMPRHCFSHLIEQGKLMEIVTAPGLPEIPYVAGYRTDLPTTFPETAAAVLKEVASFSILYQE